MTTSSPSPIDPLLPNTPPLLEQSVSPRYLPGWRLWLPLIFQSVLMIAVPAQDAYTYATGKTVVLQTVPVDPYDLLRGYSQTLSYDISSLERLKQLSGGKLLEHHSGQDFYVVLEMPAANGANLDPVSAKGSHSNLAKAPKPWKAVRVSGDRPTNLPANQIGLKGRVDGWRLTYGLETYYMPEDQREQINQAVGQAQNQPQAQTPQAFVVEVKVDANGESVPVSLWIRDRNYRF